MLTELQFLYCDLGIRYELSFDTRIEDMKKLNTWIME